MPVHRWIATGPDGLADFDFVSTELPELAPDEVTVRVRAAGVNPADLKHAERAPSYPAPVGYEVAGVVEAIGSSAQPGTPGLAVGDEVLAFRVSGGYADALNTPAEKVFRKPASLGWAEAANLLLAGTTAADMLQVVDARPGEVVVLFGASGAVGVMVLQLARLRRITVIGVAGSPRLGEVERFGGRPVARGADVLARIREAADAPIAAVLDATGSDADVDAALELVGDRDRIVTIAAPARAAESGFRAIVGSQPDSARFRDSVRAELIRLAGEGELVVPVSRTYPLADAVEALGLVASGRAGGNVALLPEQDA